MRGKVLLALAVAVVATVGGATYAIAASSGGQTYYGCVSNADGKLRVVTSADACKSNEAAISWNSEGPAGAAGAPGAPGAPGKDGRDGRDAAGVTPITASMVVTDSRQGVLPAIQVSGYSHEIVSPRDIATGQATGKRQHKPLTIVKEWNASTPLLLNALISSDVLTKVEITLSHSGTPFARVTLRDASISDYSVANETESWSFTYRKITWESLDGSQNMAEDDLRTA